MRRTLRPVVLGRQSPKQTSRVCVCRLEQRKGRHRTFLSSRQIGPRLPPLGSWDSQSSRSLAFVLGGSRLSLHRKLTRFLFVLFDHRQVDLLNRLSVLLLERRRQRVVFDSTHYTRSRLSWLDLSF